MFFRRLAISAAVLVGVGLVAAPAGATTPPQTKYLNTVHKAVPATNSISNQKLIGLGQATCKILKYAPVSVEAGVLNESSNAFHLPHGKVKAVLTAAAAAFCPARLAAVKAYKASPSKVATAAPTKTPTTAAPPTTTAPTAPPLTQQQQTAVASAKQYLELEGFSQAGLIAQLDSPDGGQFSVNDATVAVNSLNENWNAEAVRSAKSYMQLEPMSCQALIDQLDSPDGAQFTVAQATYGAQQAGDCG